MVLLDIRLQLLEHLLQIFHPVHMPAVRVSELHHDLQVTSDRKVSSVVGHAQVNLATAFRN